MYPSYNHLKIVHEQQTQEALERYSLHAGQEKQQHSLRQTLGKLLARFTAQVSQKQESPLPGCVQEEVCTSV